jgi:hypothetical protein
MPILKQLSPQSNGWAFAGLGGLFVVVGAGMLLVQFLITGEWMFEGEINNQQVGQKAIGVEFASIFLFFGMAFVFVGLAQTASSARRRVVANGLAAAQFLLIALAFGAAVLGALDIDVGLLLLLAWPLILLLGGTLATLHPAYKHAATMEQLRGSERLSTFAVPAKNDTFSKLSQNPSGDSPESARFSLPAGSVKGALIVAVVVGLIPVAFFSIFFIAVGGDSDPVAIAFVGVFIVVAAFFFGVPVFVFVLLTQALRARGGQALDLGYRAFAARVGGELVTQTIPLLGFKVPKAVLIPSGKAPCVLDLQSVGTGKSRVTYTRVTFDLPTPAGWRCQVTPQGLLDGLGSFLGLQDVQVGWDAFDDQFVVKSSHESLARTVLVLPVQERILALKQLSYRIGNATQLGSGNADLLIQENRVQMRLLAAPTSEADLMACYQACLELFELLAPRIRALGAPSSDGPADGWG